MSHLATEFFHCLFARRVLEQFALVRLNFFPPIYVKTLKLPEVKEPRAFLGGRSLASVCEVVLSNRFVLSLLSQHLRHYVRDWIKAQGKVNQDGEAGEPAIE